MRLSFNELINLLYDNYYNINYTVKTKTITDDAIKHIDLKNITNKKSYIGHEFSKLKYEQKILFIVEDFNVCIRVYNYKKGCYSELLCRCKYFEVHKEKINTQNCKEMFSFQTQSNSFHVLLCLEGCGTLISDKETLPFFKGDCIFVPANSVELKIHGVTNLLNISC